MPSCLLSGRVDSLALEGHFGLIQGRRLQGRFGSDLGDYDLLIRTDSLARLESEVGVDKVR